MNFRAGSGSAMNGMLMSRKKRSQCTSTQLLRKASPMISSMDPSNSKRSIRPNPQVILPSKPSDRPIAISLGDPAGIGAEVTLAALAHEPRPEPVVLVGCRRWLEDTYQRLRRVRPLRDPADCAIVDLPLSRPVEAGCSGAHEGDASFQWLTAATELVRQGRCQVEVEQGVAVAADDGAAGQAPGDSAQAAPGAGQRRLGHETERLRAVRQRSASQINRPSRQASAA